MTAKSSRTSGVIDSVLLSSIFVLQHFGFWHEVHLWLSLNCDSWKPFLKVHFFPSLSQFVISPQSPHITYYTLWSQTHYCVCHLFFFPSFSSVSPCVPAPCFSHTLKKLLLRLSTSTIACFRLEGRTEHSLPCNDLNTAIRWQSPNC